jgi:hypothetical protein
MSETQRELCSGTVHKGEWFQCGRVVLQRDPTKPAEACPGGLTICWDCSDEFGEFMKAAYDARAVRMEHQGEGGFEPLPE